MVGPDTRHRRRRRCSRAGPSIGRLRNGLLPWSSVDRIAAFDAFRSIGLIAPRPLLLIVGVDAVTSWMRVAAFEKARGPKELVRIEGAVHNDLYDKDEHVTPAVEKLDDFFAAHLVG